MKWNDMKRFAICMMALLGVCVLTACDSENGREGVIWDIAPVQFDIFITDEQGHDLLDSTYQGNLIKDISATYQGEEYPLITEWEYHEKLLREAKTRMYMPQFYGLMLHRYRYWSHEAFHEGDFEMIFGEFSGTENIDKREITLRLPENQTIRLAYRNSFAWKSNGDPDKNTVFYLNDQELNDDEGRRGNFHFRRNGKGVYEYVPSEIE